MPTAQDKQVIDLIVERLRQTYDPNEIILFGSHARGEVEEWGDIDVIVITDHHERFIARQREAALALEDIDEDIDVFVYTPDEWQQLNEDYNPFTQSIQANHQVLYKKRTKE